MFEYKAEVLDIIDGDTMKLRIDLGFHVHIVQVVRLAHLNTPETVKYTVNGIVDPAKQFILERLPPGAVCVVQITRQEKYGRWLATVMLDAGRSLNDELLAAGLAVPYEGGRKTN